MCLDIIVKARRNLSCAEVKRLNLLSVGKSISAQSQRSQSYLPAKSKGLVILSVQQIIVLRFQTARSNLKSKVLMTFTVFRAKMLLIFLLKSREV